ncbi:BolA family transcriptional regulator [Nitrosomonas sp. HPC101]|uniref:BolA family protein n=1 Tax=Nitrosomonas sp. HPC101 TaxID=1658667 RepID=UPI0013683093|nr:BolA/IbaG family iron-sulfur metabolism protein [Nitrosomonas sp. HPC101]MXS84393.1 BolA family transcriptional regulator [Nitrosomonas sp. HPC101]
MAGIKEQIENSLQLLQPQFLEVVNESNHHAVPAGSESHFKVTIVAEVFNSKPLVARHRLVNTTLTPEIINSIHALALHTLTPAEWQARSETARKSPPCRGGSNTEERVGARKE